MSLIPKVGSPSLSTIGPIPGACKLPALIAGEDLAAGDACRVHTDGKVMRSIGTAVNASAKVRGYAPIAVKNGEPVSLLFNVTLNYGSALTPGADVFLATTAGGLDTAATTGGTAPIGFAVDAQRIYLKQSSY